MGSGVGLVSDTAAAGTPFEDVGASPNGGTVYLFDVTFNQTPMINNQVFNIAENSTNTTVVGTVIASDPDGGQSLTYLIQTDPSAGAFNLNPTNGVLTVLDSNKLDFEVTQQIVLTVQVLDDGTPIITNSASVTVNILNVVEGADLLLTKTAPPFLSDSSNLVYTLQIANVGPLTATGVVLIDTLPPGVTFHVLTSSPGCTESNGIVTCNVGDVSVTLNRTISVIVATNTVGIVTNTATVTTTALEDGSSTNTDTAVTHITDFDGDLNPDFNDPDDDNDMMPDVWELQYGLNPTNPADAGVSDDADSFSNLEEYISDTNPTNDLSFLKIDAFDSPINAIITFESSTGRVYDIESSTNLPGMIWSPVPGLSNFFGIGGTDLRTNMIATPQEHYRLNVRLP